MMIPTLILLLTITLLAIPTEQAAPTRQPNNYAGGFCFNTTGNYSSGSSYQQSLNALLSDLVSNSSSSSFYETTSRDSGSPDHIFCRYYCRHDVSKEACNACVKTAAKRVLSNCPSSKEAVVLFQHCTLTYLNSSARLDDHEVSDSLASLLFSTVTDVNQFYPVLTATMNRLVNQSAYDPASQGFATGEAKVSQFETLYSLTQCCPNMSGVMCERCLRAALYQIDVCCKDVADVEFYYSSCQLRYSVVAPFYVVKASPAQMLNSTPPPPVANPPSGNAGKALRCWNIFQLSFITTFITMAILLLSH